MEFMLIINLESVFSGLEQLANVGGNQQVIQVIPEPGGAGINERTGAFQDMKTFA